jgi:hypothetical protein
MRGDGVRSRAMWSRRRILAVFPAIVGFCAHGARADQGGWRQARWDMSAAELDAAFPAQTRPPAGRLEFGPYVVERQIDLVTIAERGFVALFQMDRRTRLLRQVLLQFRGSRPTHTDAVSVYAALKAELDAPGLVRAHSDYSGTAPSFGLTVEWQLAGTGVVLRYLDPNAEPGSGVRKELIVRYFAA